MRSSPGISISVIPATIQRTVRGINQLEQKFEGAIAKVIAAAAVEIHKEAKLSAPVDYGILRASIYYDWKGNVNYKARNAAGDNIRSGAKQSVPYHSAESNKKGINAIIGSNLNYAHVQDTRTGYLSQAYQKVKPKIKPAIERAIQEEIKKSLFR